MLWFCFEKLHTFQRNDMWACYGVENVCSDLSPNNTEANNKTSRRGSLVTTEIQTRNLRKIYLQYYHYIRFLGPLQLSHICSVLKLCVHLFKCHFLWGETKLGSTILGGCVAFMDKVELKWAKSQFADLYTFSYLYGICFCFSSRGNDLINRGHKTMTNSHFLISLHWTLYNSFQMCFLPPNVPPNWWIRPYAGSFLSVIITSVWNPRPIRNHDPPSSHSETAILSNNNMFPAFY
jgi:hypothetical protein